jgi:uncharacterized damage-inducible protein DinB
MIRHARRITTALVVTALLIVASATAAGAGSEQPTAKQWANGICSGIETWIDSVEGTISSLKDADSLEDAAATASDEISEATETLGNDLADLGKPTTKNAQQAQKTLQKLEDQLNTDMEAIEDALADPGTEPVDIASTFAVLGTQLQKAIDQLHAAGDALKDLGANQEIVKAFESASACKALRNR